MSDAEEGRRQMEGQEAGCGRTEKGLEVEREAWIWKILSHVVPWTGALPPEWGVWKPDDRG